MPAPLGLAAGRGGGDTAHSPWRALVTAFRHGQEAECSVLAGVDNDLPAGECATRPRSSGAPSGCVAPCHTACLTHTGASSRGFQDRVARVPGVRRRIATPGARVLAPGRGRPLRGRRQRGERRRPARGACARGFKAVREGSRWSRAGFRRSWAPARRAVDDEEVACFVERQQRVVPDAGGVVHALVATRQEGPQLPGRGRRTRRRDDNEVGAARHRDEGLRSERVALHHLYRKGQRTRLSAEDRDDHAALGAGLDLGQVVIALGVAGIDGEVPRGVARLDDIAEGAKASRLRGSMDRIFAMARPLSSASRPCPTGAVARRRRRGRC